MKKMMLVAMMLDVALSCFANSEYKESIVTPVSLGLTYSLRYPASNDVTVYGLRAGVWMNDMDLDMHHSARANNINVYGVSIGLLTMIDHEVTGFQISGWGNTVDTLRGLQTSFFLNKSMGSIYGCQISMGGNTIIDGKRRSTKGNLYGIQASLLCNWCEEDTNGIQMALLNVGSDVSGVQAGLVNGARDVKGMQIGLLNMARDLKGVQIGLLNLKEARSACVFSICPILRVGW